MKKPIKNNLRKLGLLMAASLTLAACGGPAESSSSSSSPSQPSSQSSQSSASSSSSSSQSSQSTPSSQSSAESSSSVEPLDEGAVAPYEGDASRTVEKIPNAPVEAYQKETMKAFEHLVFVLSKTRDARVAENIADVFLHAGIGDALAIKACKAIEDVYNIGMKGFALKDYAAFGEDASDFKDAFYELLSVINSIDASKLGDLMQYISGLIGGSMVREYVPQSIYQYFKYSLGDVDYPQYLRMKKYASDDPIISDFLEEYEAKLAQVKFSAAAQDEYQAYVDRYEEYNNPTSSSLALSYFEFIANHASLGQELLVKDLKLFIDAYLGLTKDLAKALHSSTESRLQIRAAEGYTITSYSSRDNSALLSLLRSVLSDKETFLGFLKAVLADEQMGELYLDFLIEFTIPGLRSANEDDVDALAEIDRLETKLKTLSGKHLTAVFDLVLRLANALDLGEVFDFIQGLSSGEEVDIFAFIDSNLEAVEAALSSIKATDKVLLLELGAIFDIDILAKLNEILAIYKAKDLSTEEGAAAFQKDVMAWLAGLAEKVMPIVSLFMSSSSEDIEYEPDIEIEPIDDKVIIEASVYGTLTQGSTLTADDIFISFRDPIMGYESGSQLSGWNDSVAYYKGYVESLSPEERARYEENNPYYLQQLEWIATLEISDVNISLDTSNLGVADFFLSFTLLGESYTVTSFCNIEPVEMTYVSYSYIYSSSGTTIGAYNYDDYSSLTVAEKGMELTWAHQNESGDYVGDSVDSSSEGLHVVSSKGRPGEICYSFYYIIDPDNMDAYLDSKEASVAVAVKLPTGGYYLNSNPSCYCHYSFLDGSYTFTRSYFIPEDDVQTFLEGKDEGLYTMTKDGIDYEIAVLGGTRKNVSRYTFEISSEAWRLGMENVPTTVSATIEAEVNYYAEIDGVIFTTTRSEEYEDNLSDFAYEDGVVSFKYAGQSYSFEFTLSAVE